MKTLRFKKFLCMILFIFIMLFSFNSQIELKADDNIYSNGYAYYKVNETLEQSELYDGVVYRHDSAMTLISDQSKIIGYECGGKTYGDNPLYKNKEYTQSAHVLTVPASSDVKIAVWSVVKNGTWKLSSILDIAKDYEAHNPGYKIIAGINGDFFDIDGENNYPYTTHGAWVNNGEVYKAETTDGWRCVEFHNDGSLIPYTNHQTSSISEKPTLYVYDKTGKVIFEQLIDNVNDVSGIGETSLFFAEYNDKHTCVSIDVENAYIVENADMSVAVSRASFYGKGNISKIGEASLNINQFAIKTSNTILKEYLKVGSEIKVQYNFEGEMSGATEVTGYVTNFLKNGKHVEGDLHYGYMDYRYPRTLVGYRLDGTLVLAATDGRQASKGYYGLNGVESSAQMAYYGCVDAFSLDGGGSTSMVVLKDGELVSVNSPSDGHIRSDGNAIFLVVPVPEVNMGIETSDTSITVKLDVLEMISEFKELYIEVNGEKKKYEENQLVFENLKSNTKYPVYFYEKDGDDFKKLPLQTAVTTKKMMFEVNYMLLEIVEIKGVEYYQLTWDISDPDNCISNIMIKVGREKVYMSEGKLLVKKTSGSPSTCDGELSIIYSLLDGASKETYYYNVKTIEYKDAVTFASSINDKLSKSFDEILE